MKLANPWIFLLLLAALQASGQTQESRPRARDLGLTIGVLPPGPLNAITDVGGVRVGHATVIRGDNVRTGITVVLPHGGNLFQEKVPGAVFVGNGFGKLVGSTQVNELGEIETPIALTSTLNVPRVSDALLDHMLCKPGNEDVRSVNALVAETNDGWLNDIRGRHVGREEVVAAIGGAKGGPVEEGAVGAGTGTIAFGWKGGIGTASRKLPSSLGGYTVGVLVQSNFGGVLTMDGAPVGEELGQYYLREHVEGVHPKGTNAGPRREAKIPDGSIIIVVATDAPVQHRNLMRMAARGMMGLARTGSSGSNGSGDYVIAFSTATRVKHGHAGVVEVKELSNEAMSPLFQAVIEATEEAIYNSMLKATTMTGNGRTVEALPLEKVREILRKYGALN